MQPTQSQEAIPLITQGDIRQDVEDDYGPALEPRRSKEYSDATVSSRSTSSILLLLASLVSLLSLSWNILLLSVDELRLTRHPSGDKIDVTKLRRPSLYLGLERVPEISLAHGYPRPHPIPPSASPAHPGWPSVLARVNQLDPDQVVPRDDWILLTEQDHTILQFSNPEGDGRGLTCAFTAVFPPRSALRDKLLTIELDGDDVGASPTIQLVEAPQNFDWSNASWNHRPLSSEKPLASIPARFGQNWTSESFPCPDGSPMVMEAACVGRACRIEFSADPALLSVDPVLGIRLVVVPA